MRRRKGGFARRALSLTPLIDIIFLLLLFFMLSSTFTNFAEVPLILAGNQRSEDHDATRSQVFVRLSFGGASVNGAPTDFADIPAAISKAAAGQAPLVLLSVSDDATSQLFVDTLTRVRSTPEAEVVVIR